MPLCLVEVYDSETRCGLRILMPSQEGAAALMKALKGAVHIESDRTYENPPYVVLAGEIVMEIRQLPRHVKLRAKVDGVEVEVSAAPRKTAGKLNGHKSKTLPAPDSQRQLGLRLMRGGA